MITIRPMLQGDIPQCLLVASECWSKFTAQCAYPDFLEMFSAAAFRPFYYVAVEEEKVVGMVGYNTSWLSYGIYNMFWLGVRPAYRKQGIATKLMNRCLEDLLPIADVIMGVTDIPEFYHRWGFKTISLIETTEATEVYGDSIIMLQNRGK